MGDLMRVVAVLFLLVGSVGVSTMRIRLIGVRRRTRWSAGRTVVASRSGSAATGCYYWGGTAQVVIDGVRSNQITF